MRLCLRFRADEPRTTVGWIATIRALGDIFQLQGFFVWHTVMAVIMVIVWFVLFLLTVLAFWKGKIFMAKDEDVLKDSGLVPTDVEKGEF